MDKKFLFALLFSVLALAAYELDFSSIIGAEGQQFTFFQFVGPIGGNLFGPLTGAASVLAVQVMEFFVAGKEFTLINLLRLLPMVFAAVYFGSKKKENVFVALACMALFWLHPEGGQAWAYALFWLIPIAAKYLAANNLVAQSLGATFTAHAVGSVAFLYALNIPAATWWALIPVTAMERALFAGGIAVSYLAVNAVLDRVASRAGYAFKHPQYALLQ